MVLKHGQSLLEAKSVSEIVQTSLQNNKSGTIAILVRAKINPLVTL
jgi:hypothetical protein